MRHCSIASGNPANMKPATTTGINAAPHKGNKADQNNASK
jgi:hypothetical protein